MNAPVKPPANALPEWRLDDLYSGRDDPRIEADLAEARADQRASWRRCRAPSSARAADAGASSAR